MSSMFSRLSPPLVFADFEPDGLGGRAGEGAHHQRRAGRAHRLPGRHVAAPLVAAQPQLPGAGPVGAVGRRRHPDAPHPRRGVEAHRYPARAAQPYGPLPGLVVLRTAADERVGEVPRAGAQHLVGRGVAALGPGLEGFEQGRGGRAARPRGGGAFRRAAASS